MNRRSRSRLILQGRLFVAAGVLTGAVTTVEDARASADRYGGVWHDGAASGAFVPASAGMTYNDVQNYRSSWEGLRITDLEIIASACREEENEDLFATNWERGTWNDKLKVVDTLIAVQQDVELECENGYVLQDFEIWNTWCSDDRYVLLYRETGDCDLELSPRVVSSSPNGLDAQVQVEANNGRYLVDYEIDETFPGSNPGGPMNPTIVIGIYYGGQVAQKVTVLDRPAFEQQMKNQEGVSTLVDMEGFVEWPDYEPNVPKTRYVMGLFDTLSSNADEHEVGEVYTKFRDLIYLKENDRRLADFELYPWTYDERFVKTFASHYDDFGGGYAFSVLQAGEHISHDARGYARRPDPSSSFPGLPMHVHTRAAVASVTKQFTTLGVLTWIEDQAQGVQGTDMTVVNWWLDQPFTNFMPPDFTNFGTGVQIVTMRELMQHLSGFENFGDYLEDNQLAFNRANIISFLQLPVAVSNPTNRRYQNLHFEILALIMDETILPAEPSISSTTDPWREWMNEQVFQPAGVGPLLCGSTAQDALSYPQITTGASHGLEWLPANTICTGDNTGGGMFWASAKEIAKVSYGTFTANTIVSQPIADMIRFERLGLDGFVTATTLGDDGRWKNGGLGGCNSLNELVGSQTLLATYDDNDVDDNWAPDYIYNPGGTEFDVGIMNHSSNSVAGCIKNPPANMLGPDRILEEALKLPEAW